MRLRNNVIAKVCKKAPVKESFFMRFDIFYVLEFFRLGRFVKQKGCRSKNCVYILKKHLILIYFMIIILISFINNFGSGAKPRFFF